MPQKLTGFLGSNVQPSEPTTDVWLSLHRGVSVRSGYSLAMGTHLPGLQIVHELVTVMSLKTQVCSHIELHLKGNRKHHLCLRRTEKSFTSLFQVSSQRRWWWGLSKVSWGGGADLRQHQQMTPPLMSVPYIQEQLWDLEKSGCRSRGSSKGVRVAAEKCKDVQCPFRKQKPGRVRTGKVKYQQF